MSWLLLLHWLGNRVYTATILPKRCQMRQKFKRFRWISVIPDKHILKVKPFGDRKVSINSGAWGIMKLHSSCLLHQSLQNNYYFWYFSCSVNGSYYWAYSNRKICYFVFILLTMESDFFHNFGPFILFIILWLLMSHPLGVCHLKAFFAGEYFLQFLSMAPFWVVIFHIIS